MGALREITSEYIGSLEYVREVPRKFSIPSSPPDIIAILGPRRVGKTFIMLKKTKELLERSEQALYVPFDEPLVRKTGVREFAEMVRAEYPEGRVHLFLDEVQEWPEWGRKLRWMHDVRDFFLYVSGSSAALQSSEIPTQLRGRYISRLLLPLSFQEVAGSAGVTFRERGRIRSLLDDYLKWGGFPEVWLFRSREKVVSLLETIFYRDIVERHGIRNLSEFRDVFYFVLSNYSNPVTWNSLRRLLKGQGVSVDTKTLINYVEYMREAFLIFTVHRFSHSERVRRISPKKIYLVDVAISNLFREPMDLGRRMENLTFLELLRRVKGPGEEISYYITRSGNEIDFLVERAGRVVELIEVAYELDGTHLKKVLEACRELRIGEATVISWKGEGTVSRGGCTVEEIPLWKWLTLDLDGGGKRKELS